MRTKLTTNDLYGKMILKHIEENASDTLVEKINSGIKTMDQCMSFIKTEARKKAVSGVAMVEDMEVYGWAMHFFEEDSIKATAEPKRPDTVQRAIAEPKKEENKAQVQKDGQLAGQMNIFDMLGGQ